MNYSLNQIRAKPDSHSSSQRKLIQAALSLFLGALCGFLAKYFDPLPYVGAIGTSLGVWILIATLLAAWSRSPKASALHVFLFFAAMLTLYYLYSMVLFGFFPKYYFIAWGGIALLTPIGAFIVWYARANGWLAAFCAALPIAFLLLEGYPFFYIGAAPQGFDILAAVFLVAVLTNKWIQRARILLIAGILFLIFRQFHVLSLIFGGL